MVVLSVAFDIDGGGAAARLIVARATPAGPLTLVDGSSNLFYDRANLRDDSSKESLTRAKAYVTHVVGWPPTDVQLIVSFAGLGAPPSIIGGSLYGAFCLSLMRIVVDLGAYHRWASDTVVPLVRAVALERVAISAECSQANAGFAKVGSVDIKLGALTAVSAEHFAVVVLAQEEIVPASVQAVPRLMAADPVDAFKKLCAFQALGTLALL